MTHQILTSITIKWGALNNLVPFLQFKKREKHRWRSVTFSKVADFSLFHVFLNCTNGTKSSKASEMFPMIKANFYGLYVPVNVLGLI